VEDLKKVLIGPEISVNQAMKRMDEGAEKILFVVDNENRLLGTVTDGDIRRWILKQGSLSNSISEVMNKNPIFLKEGYQIEQAKLLMITKKIECIPIVDERMRIISALRWLDLFETRKRHKKINIPVVIMAGGQGTRLSPFTKILPKPLIPVGEKPIIEIIIEKFLEYGCKKFYLSVNYKSNLIKAYFNDFKRQGYDIDIYYIQEEKPMGTIGSLCFIRNKIKSTFFVTNCDVLIEADYDEILKFHLASKNSITLVASMKHYTIPYGVCEISEDGVLKQITEKPEYDFLVSAGFYVLEPEVIRYIPHNKYFNMIDLIQDCRKKGERVGIYPIFEKSWLDIGEWETLQETLKRFGAR